MYQSVSCNSYELESPCPLQGSSQWKEGQDYYGDGSLALPGNDSTVPQEGNLAGGIGLHCPNSDGVSVCPLKEGTINHLCFIVVCVPAEECTKI